MVLTILCAIPIACSQPQRDRFEQRIDAIAIPGERIAQQVSDLAGEGAKLGIPGAGVIALAASMLGTILGIYNERRRTTTPLRTALTQVVRSVETAFPQRTNEQKSAMSSVQDGKTRKLVSGIKGD
jgi:hypothetical protein